MESGPYTSLVLTGWKGQVWGRAVRGEPALSCIWDTCFSPVLASNQLATGREHLPFPFHPFSPQDRAQEQGPHILLEGATSTRLLLALMAFVGMRTPPPSSEQALRLPAVDPNWLNLPTSEDLWVFPPLRSQA